MLFCEGLEVQTLSTT